MNRILPLALVFFASCSTIPMSQPAPSPLQERSTRGLGEEPGSTHHINFYYGQRALDESDFGPADDHDAIGLEYVNEAPESVIGWEIGAFISDEEETAAGLTREVTFNEYYVGLRKTFRTDTRLVPYIGAGVALVDVERADNGVGAASFDDTSEGFYVHGGVALKITDWLYAGIDARLLTGTDFELGTSDFDADYEQVSLVLGVSL